MTVPVPDSRLIRTTRLLLVAGSDPLAIVLPTELHIAEDQRRQLRRRIAQRLGDDETAFEPQIRVVEGGNVVMILPLLRYVNTLWLDYDVKVSRLEDVSERTVQVAGWKEPLTLLFRTLLCFRADI